MTADLVVDLVSEQAGFLIIICAPEQNPRAIRSQIRGSVGRCQLLMILPSRQNPNQGTMARLALGYAAAGRAGPCEGLLAKRRIWIGRAGLARADNHAMRIK